jgi:uncharacterized protein YdaU (DUF1376 family)
MAKDPRFNFYPDNWTGGTKRMTFEQKGAYLELLMLNFYCFSDGLKGFTEREALHSLAHAAAYAALWEFLKSKFKQEGEFFYSERMQKEFLKAKVHSEKQSERAKKRVYKTSAHPAEEPTASAAADACNGLGSGIGNDLKNKKESQNSDSRETQNEKEIIAMNLVDSSLDELYLSNQRMVWRHLNFDFEVNSFREKVRGAPEEYLNRDTAGIRMAFQYQLRKATSNPNGTSKTGNKNTDHIGGLAQDFAARNS